MGQGGYIPQYVLRKGNIKHELMGILYIIDDSRIYELIIGDNHI